MTQGINLVVVTPKGKVFQGYVNHVTLPGELAPFQIYRGHAPIVSSLRAGGISYAIGLTLYAIQIQRGFVFFLDNEVKIACEGCQPIMQLSEDTA